MGRALLPEEDSGSTWISRERPTVRGKEAGPPRPYCARLREAPLSQEESEAVAEVLEEEMAQTILLTPNSAVQPFPEEMWEALPSALSSPGPSGPQQGNQVPEFQDASFVPFLPFLVLCRE